MKGRMLPLPTISREEEEVEVVTACEMRKVELKSPSKDAHKGKPTRRPRARFRRCIR